MVLCHSWSRWSVPLAKMVVFFGLLSSVELAIDSMPPPLSPLDHNFLVGSNSNNICSNNYLKNNLILRRYKSELLF